MALTSDGFGGTTKGRSDTSQTGRVPTSSGSTYNQNSRTSGGSTMPLQSSQSGRKTILSGPSVKCHQEALQFDRRLKKKELESFPSQDLASHLENLTSLMAAAGNTEKSNKYQRVLQSARDQLGSKEDSEQLRSVLVAGVMQARNDLGPLNNFEPFVCRIAFAVAEFRSISSRLGQRKKTSRPRYQHTTSSSQSLLCCPAVRSSFSASAYISYPYPMLLPAVQSPFPCLQIVYRMHFVFNHC